MSDKEKNDKVERQKKRRDRRREEVTCMDERDDKKMCGRMEKECERGKSRGEETKVGGIQ